MWTPQLTGNHFVSAFWVTNSSCYKMSEKTVEIIKKQFFHLILFLFLRKRILSSDTAPKRKSSYFLSILSIIKYDRSFQVVLFLALGSFLTVYTDKYSFECWRKTFCRPLEFSLCVGLSLLELCPANSLCTDLPALPVLSPILRESLGSACVPFHCSVTWKLSSYYAWAIVGLISSVFHLSGITVFCYMMYSVLAIFCSI